MQSALEMTVLERVVKPGAACLQDDVGALWLLSYPSNLPSECRQVISVKRVIGAYLINVIFRIRFLEPAPVPPELTACRRYI